MILIAYKSDLYKEYVLPNSDNSDFTLLLDRGLFGFSRDIVLNLELTDGTYKIYSTSEYTVKIKGSAVEETTLSHGDIISIKTKRGERFNGIIADNIPRLDVVKKYDISDVSYISIGEDKNNIISYNFYDLVSKYHCEIKKQNGEYYICDNSTNGIFLDSHRIEKQHRLSFGEIFNIFGLHIVFLGNTIGIASNYGDLTVNSQYLKEKKDFSVSGYEKSGKKQSDDSNFSRAPRVMPTLDTEPVDIEEPPAPKFSKKKPLIYTIGPAFTMAIPMLIGSSMAIVSAQSTGRSASAFMFTGIITAIGSAVIGVIWALLNLRYARQSEAEEEQERFNAYGNYLLDVVARLQGSYANNTAALNSMYPSASDCCRYDINTSTLWNRNRTHQDYLFCRLGIGELPFQVEINTPKHKFNIQKDNLREKPDDIKKEYEILKNVPVGIDMKESCLFGIVGGAGQAGAMQVVYNIVSQVATNNCYTDVKMVFVYNEKSAQDRLAWEFARWLPHVWSEDKKTRYLASNKIEASDIFYELATTLRIRSEESKENFAAGTAVPKPYYLLFIQDTELLDGQLISKYIFDPKEEYGITTFIMSDTYTALPNECENIIENDKYFCGTYNIASVANRKAVAFDNVSSGEVLALAKRLSEIKVSEAESVLDIPQSIDFFEMFGVKSLKALNVEERWKKNRTFNSMSAVVGKRSGGEDCCLDIHEKFHGPHGLVAGTTGSGKSELLQTYILSLAVNYSPEDIAFFIIDYKGGGMANLFGDLPHMIGQISNLSGNQIRRAMISIKSENRRRQRLFNECGVNNINHYTRLYKNHEVSTPIPHLFIIIDEFAELKKEEPEFMREFISVAQVGRSLGVHLILATQKPSGTVDDNIWSNSKFKLCLRVQDKQDSNDMLHKPDAAYISQAGRAYLQVGNDELYELFQSGWSGAPYNESDMNSNSDIAMMIQNTGKTAIVGSRHQKKAKDKERFAWYTTIADHILKIGAEMKILDISAVKDADRSFIAEIVARVIKSLIAEGADFADTVSNRTSLENFISLLPKGVNDAATVAAYVQQQAMQNSVKLPEKKEKTQLEAVVGYLSKIAKKEGYNYNLKLWLPVLPEALYLDDIKAYVDDTNMYGMATGKGKWNLSAVVGMYDDPENQAQLPLTVDFANNGHHAILGMVVSGKSTFLQTLVYSLITKYTPEQLNVYILDYSSHMLTPFEDAPHCGGVVTDQQEDKISKFFCMLDKEMNYRKQLLNGGDYAQYVRSGKSDLPAWVIVIDNFAGMREKTESRYDDAVLRLAKEGIGYGIYMIVSAGGFGISEIPNRIGDNIRTVVSLEMGDKFKYMDVMRTTKLNTLPEQGTKGRGLVSVEGNILEFHTALAFNVEDDFAKNRILGEKCQEMSLNWKGRQARPIPNIPQNFNLDWFTQLQDYTDTVAVGTVLPFALRESDASMYGVDLSSTYCFGISGKSRTGKTTALKVLMNSAKAVGCEITVFEKGITELKKTAELCGASYITSDKEHFDFWSGIKDEFIRRNQIKRGMLNEGASEKEIYNRMKQDKPICLFVANIDDFVESVYKPEKGVGEMKGFVENVTEKGMLHNIFIFACINTESAGVTTTYQVYKNFISYKTGVHLGGNINSQRIFSFQNIPYAEQAKAMKKGLGLVPAAEDDTIAERVVIPNA